MNKTMKNKLFIAIFFLFTLFSFGAMAEASSTISFDSSEVKANLNGDFPVKVYVDSYSVEKDYTVRAALRFSSEQLSVKNFEFADGWMPLSASGYDLVDNTNGVLIKTAGYPEGWNGKILLGTITFTSKDSSIGKIEVSNQSFSLNENGDNVLLPGGEVEVTVLNSNGTKPVKVYTLPVEQYSNFSIFN